MITAHCDNKTKLRETVPTRTMKLLFQLCFLVLAVLCVSPEHTPAPVFPNRDQKEPLVPQRQNGTSNMDIHQKEVANISTTPWNLNITTEEPSNTSEPTTATPTPPIIVQPSSVTPPREKEEPGKESNEDPAPTSPASATTEEENIPISGVSGPAWGYVILVLILIVIVALCIILYMLRRASRMYSFDLQRPLPSSNSYEPTGTFGQVYLDDLDRPDHKDVISDDLSTSPVPNGTGPHLEEKAAEEQNAPQEQTEANDPQSSSSSSSGSISLSADDQAEKKSNQMSSNNLFFDAVTEPQPPLQQNENNNNPAACAGDPFVEINLDEPAWSGQLLDSPRPASSAHRFPSFSFSSSSTGSS